MRKITLLLMLLMLPACSSTKSESFVFTDDFMIALHDYAVAEMDNKIPESPVLGCYTVGGSPSMDCYWYETVDIMYDNRTESAGDDWYRYRLYVAKYASTEHDGFIYASSHLCDVFLDDEVAAETSDNVSFCVKRIASRDRNNGYLEVGFIHDTYVVSIRLEYVKTQDPGYVDELMISNGVSMMNSILEEYNLLDWFSLQQRYLEA